MRAFKSLYIIKSGACLYISSCVYYIEFLVFAIMFLYSNIYDKGDRGYIDNFHPIKLSLC